MGSQKLLFDEILGRQIDGSRYARLKNSVKSNCSLLQRLRILNKFQVHRGCVNTLSWNAAGNLLLSGSDDHRLVITNPYNYKQVDEVHTSHRANIFSAKFLPETGDLKLVSCAGDGTILLTDVTKQEETHGCTFNCHNGTVYEMLAIPGDPNSFFSCGEDGTVRWFDIRVKTSCRKDDCKDDIMIGCGRAVTSICLNPLVPYHLAVGCSDSTVRVFDRRLLGTSSNGSIEETSGFGASQGFGALFSRFSVPDFEGKQRRITSVDYRPDGQELLVSYSSDYLYIFDPREDNPNKGKRLKVGRPKRKSKSGRSRNKSPQPMKKLRLRGDWSDTGPNARPETDEPATNQGATSSDEPTLQTTLMQRMTDALSRMLNDPGTRTAMQRVSQGEEQSNARDIRESLNLGDEDAAGGEEDQQTTAATAIQQRWRQFKRSRQARSDEGSTITATASSTESSFIPNDTANQTQQEGSTSVGAENHMPAGTSCTRPSCEADCSSLLCCRSRKVSPNPPSKQNSSTQLLKVSLESPEQDESSIDINQSTLVQPEPDTVDSVAHVEQSQNDKSKTQSLDLQTSETLTMSDPQAEGGNFVEVEKSKMFDFVHSVIDITKNFQVGQEDKDTNESIADNDVEVEMSVLEDNSKASNEDVKIENHIKDGSKTDDSPSNLTINNSNILVLNNTNISNNNQAEKEYEAESLEGSSKNLDNLQESIENLRETGVEPTVALTYREEGTSSSSISVGEPVSLPGPSRIVTGPVTGGINPVTGARQRRTGMSSVPTSSILLQERSVSLESEEEQDTNLGIIEYETDESEDELDEQGIELNRSINQPPYRKKFVGHRNARTMIKEAAWWGNNYVLSGSDCGHLFAWERESCKLVMMVEADKHVVNCVQPHPTDPLLATSGIDYDVKLWAPIGDQPSFDLEAANVVMKRNDVMLEETRDTITVPASLMIRMLASLNQIRRGQVVPRVLEPRDETQ